MDNLSRGEVARNLLDACELVELEGYVCVSTITAMVVSLVYPASIIPVAGCISLLLGLTRPFRLEPSSVEMEKLITDVETSGSYRATVRKYALGMIR
jgi:hypothetical protein